jgi:hypothetical protein
MNTIVNHEFEILHQTEAMRGQMMELLTDSDLTYRLPGDNVTLGELCWEIGAVQRSYIDSFKTFKQDFTYEPPAPGMMTSIAKLNAWYQSLDREMDAVMMALSEDDVQSRFIERGFPVKPGMQLHIYREALLIFYGKASLYLRALGKPLPEQMREWIG